MSKDIEIFGITSAVLGLIFMSWVMMVIALIALIATQVISLEKGNA